MKPQNSKRWPIRVSRAHQSVALFGSARPKWSVKFCLLQGFDPLSHNPHWQVVVSLAIFTFRFRNGEVLQTAKWFFGSIVFVGSVYTSYLASLLEAVQNGMLCVAPFLTDSLSTGKPSAGSPNGYTFLVFTLTGLKEKPSDRFSGRPTPILPSRFWRLKFAIPVMLGSLLKMSLCGRVGRRLETVGGGIFRPLYTFEKVPYDIS